MNKIKVLYIQHAVVLGGSAMSLLYTIRALNKDIYHPVIALINPSNDLEQLYRSNNIETICWSGIFCWNHSTVSYMPWYNIFTWIHIIKVIKNWKTSKIRTLELIEQVKPDIVHLNSMPLSASASALIKNKTPLVWHVREPAKPASGLRHSIIRKIMMKADELIFISEADRKSWVRGKKGTVLHNFVDLKIFDCNNDGISLRKQLNIPENAFVILYLGGINKVKGIFVLLEALHKVKEKIGDIYCIMPGSKYYPSGSFKSKIAHIVMPLISNGTWSQQLFKMIDKYHLEKNCKILPYNNDIAQYFACSDILVFPATRPHFARPVIEAGAMKKAVIASNLDGMEELVVNGSTGILTEQGKAEQLADSIIQLYLDTDLRQRMGNAGFEQVMEKFVFEKQIIKLEKIYQHIISK